MTEPIRDQLAKTPVVTHKFFNKRYITFDCIDELFTLKVGQYTLSELIDLAEKVKEVKNEQKSMGNG